MSSSDYLLDPRESAAWVVWVGEDGDLRVERFENSDAAIDFAGTIETKHAVVNVRYAYAGGYAVTWQVEN